MIVTKSQELLQATRLLADVYEFVFWIILKQQSGQLSITYIFVIMIAFKFELFKSIKIFCNVQASGANFLFFLTKSPRPSTKTQVLWTDFSPMAQRKRSEPLGRARAADFERLAGVFASRVDISQTVFRNLRTHNS